MAFLQESFDINTLPQNTSFDCLPDGWYSATIGGADLKDTKAGTGQYISIKYTINGPTHAGRVVFGNLNIKNPNPKAEEIGRQQLGEIMRAIGVAKVTDTDQLVGGSLSIKLSTSESEQYGDSNDVKGFKPIGDKESQAPDASLAKSAPPWAKK